MSTIQIQHITKVYGTKDNACTALHDVSLEIKKRRVCCDMWDKW